MFFWQSRLVNLSCKYFDCLVTAAPILVKCLETDPHVLVGGEEKGLEKEKDWVGYQPVGNNHWLLTGINNVYKVLSRR